MFKSHTHPILTLALAGCTTSSANKAHPKALRMDKPEYPFYAAKNHIEGKVQFFYDVDAQGKVSEMRMCNPPDHLFDDADL
ncbi:energy transducer TonB (plasmid) [Pseudomonas silvicola]|nr:energy transducer TonB [Pseudomonas silvicola]